MVLDNNSNEQRIMATFCYVYALIINDRFTAAVKQEQALSIHAAFRKFITSNNLGIHSLLLITSIVAKTAIREKKLVLTFFGGDFVPKDEGIVPKTLATILEQQQGIKGLITLTSSHTVHVHQQIREPLPELAEVLAQTLQENDREPFMRVCTILEETLHYINAEKIAHFASRSSNIYSYWARSGGVYKTYYEQFKQLENKKEQTSDLQRLTAYDQEEKILIGMFNQTLAHDSK